MASFGSPYGTVPWALKQNAAASATPSLIWFETADGYLGWIGAGGTATLAMGGLSGNALALYSNSTRRMFFDTSGHVGIGTSTPAYTLDVAGSINSSATATAAGFSGNGSGLTSLNPANLSAGTAAINISGNAATATTAGTATSATTASNALYLGGVAAGKYARLDIGNSFTGTQTVASGDVSVSSGNLDLPQTTGATTGVITLGGSAFIHACCVAAAGNTFVGISAGNFTTTGSGNTGTGYFALVNTSGNYNTAIGFDALAMLSSGGNNIAIGDAAGWNVTSGSNNIYIGHPGWAGDSGIIRIGTSAVQTATYLTGTVYVEDSTTLGPYSYGYLNSSGNTGTSSYQMVPVSLYAGARILATEFDAYSDERMKQVTGRSNTQRDLEAVRQLQVTDYRYIDTVANGSRTKKGFVAQEVSSVIPEAVSASPGFLPSIYALATAEQFDAGQKTLTVTLAKPHKLAVGDKVRLYTSSHMVERTVTRIPSERQFLVPDWDEAVDQVFVYGKYVTDSLAVDYTRLFTTGIGAIQELAKQSDAKEARIAQLENEVAKLKAELETLVDTRAGEVNGRGR
jgi:hypothetical protein